MKKLLIVATLMLTLTFQALAQDRDAEVKTLTELSNSYGSHLAYAQAKLLINKYGLRDMTQERNLSRYSLHSDLYGGFHVGSSEFQGRLDIYTGKRAIDESLQLESIDALENEFKKRTRELSSVEALKVKSHPWEEMLKEVEPGPDPSPILKLVPEDHLVIYFKEAATISQLEGALRELAAGAEALFEVDNSLKIRRQTAKRLGVQKFQEFEALMGETVFVSEDLDFFPNTHYALIFKGEAAKTGANMLLESPAKGALGDYFVVASSQALFDRIAKVHAGELPSMFDSLDYRYANAVLDKRRDGLVYLSEAFILKLVSPAHRINAARRLGAVERLEGRQYAVLAYRCLTGKFPKTFHQMVKEGYLKAAPEDRTFTITPEGIVNHRIWGSLYDLKALSDVPILRVTKDEKRLYERFLRGYENFWRAFFDPIGVAFQVDEELYFHTIILPLINNSEYNDVARVAGGKVIAFQGLQSPLLRGPLSFHSRFNFDNFLLFLHNRWRMPETEQERETAKATINDEFQEEANLDPPVDLFALVGDEMALTLATDFDPSINWNANDIPVYASFQLTDKENFRRAARALFAGNPNYEILEKTHQEVTYLELPFWADLKIYIIYHGDFLHFTLHEPTILALCVASKADPQSGTFLGSKLLGDEHNVLFRGDFASLDGFRSALASIQNKRSAYRQMRDAVGYALDISLLDEALGKEGAALAYFREPPLRMYGVPLTSKKGKVLYGGRSVEDLDFSFSYVTKSNPPEKKEKTTLLELVQEHSDGKLEAKMKNFDSLSVTMEFTPEGLSTKVAVNNPVRNPVSALIAATSGDDVEAAPATVFGSAAKLGAGAVVLFILGLLMASGMRKNGS